MWSELTIGGLHDDLASRLTSSELSGPVLDIGCGSGAWLRRLRARGVADLYGVDSVEPAEHDFYRFLKTNLDSAADLDFGGVRFSLISAIEVIEHLERPTVLYDIARRFLRPDGVLLITTPNIHSLPARLRFLAKGALSQFDDLGDPTHLAPVLISTSSRALTRYGLEMHRSWGYPARGSLIHRRPIRWAAALLRFAVPEPYAGDTLCMKIRRSNGQARN